jgi:hypothetical protein
MMAIIATPSTFALFILLQVTCPLLTFALRDLCAKIMGISNDDNWATRSTGLSSNSTRALLAFALIGTAMLLAINLSESFAPLCSFIGSVTTTANSIVLPIAFYHGVTTYTNTCTAANSAGKVLNML